MRYQDSHSSKKRAALAGIGLCLLSSCAEEKPHTVDEFIADARLLEATVVRCAANRLELKYTAECINAREAVDRIAVRKEVESRAAKEAESTRKREALRRSQEAAAAARARAEEAERLRREAEYLQQFDDLPATAAPQSIPPPAQQEPSASSSDSEPPPSDDTTPTLDEVREELRRRQQTPPP